MHAAPALNIIFISPVFGLAHLEYASTAAMWDPHQIGLIHTLEMVQVFAMLLKFAQKIGTLIIIYNSLLACVLQCDLTHQQAGFSEITCFSYTKLIIHH